MLLEDYITINQGPHRKMDKADEAESRPDHQKWTNEQAGKGLGVQAAELTPAVHSTCNELFDGQYHTTLVV